MSKLSKDEKIFLKFRKEFSFVFNDKIFNNKLDEHFDKDGVFVCFLLALLTNKFNKTRLIKLMKTNAEEWLSFFTKLYLDKEIIETYNQLELNPCIEFNQVVSSFKCFDKFINSFISFIEEHDIQIDFENNLIADFIRKGFGFLMYNMIELQIPYDLDKVVRDEKYDTKVQMLIYNARLFGAIKQLILNNCNNNINDFVVLILGMSKNLSEEK